jgi:hypothetical protein
LYVTGILGNLPGKKGKYEFWGIYQIFPNKFGSPINSTQDKKQFGFQNF